MLKVWDSVGERRKQPFELGAAFWRRVTIQFKNRVLYPAAHRCDAAVDNVPKRLWVRVLGRRLLLSLIFARAMVFLTSATGRFSPALARSMISSRASSAYWEQQPNAGQ